MPITEAPLLPKVVITSPTVRTFDPLASPAVLDFNLLHLDFEMASEGMAGKFNMKIEDSAGSLLSALDCGDTVEIWVGKTNPISQKMFIGKVENFHKIRLGKDIMVYQLQGPSLDARLLHRIVNFARFQARQSDGVTPDDTDSSTEIGTLVRDLLEDTDSYPTGEPTFANDEGITFDIDNTGLKIPSFIVDYKPVADALRELADMASRNFYITHGKVFKFKATEIIDSGILIVDDPDDSEATGWNQSKLAHINEDNPLDVWETIEDTRNRLFGIGGDEIKLDQKQETFSGGSDALDANYRAIKFTPTQNRMQYVTIYVKKTGSPNVSLDGEVVQDKSNNPTGALLKAFSIRDGLVAAGGGWVIADVGIENVQVDKAHWIILREVGTAGNTFEWYHDGGTSSTHATSTDGANWTVNSNAKGYAFRTLSAIRLLFPEQDQTSITNYGLREHAFSNPEITEWKTMEKLVIGMLNVMGKKKRVVSLNFFPSDTLPEVGQSVKIKDAKTGVNGQFEVVNLHLSWDYEEQQLGATSVGLTAVGLVD
jgi:hypothetical protein